MTLCTRTILIWNGVNSFFGDKFEVWLQTITTSKMWSCLLFVNCSSHLQWMALNANQNGQRFDWISNQSFFLWFSMNFHLLNDFCYVSNFNRTCVHMKILQFFRLCFIILGKFPKKIRKCNLCENHRNIDVICFTPISSYLCWFATYGGEQALYQWKFSFKCIQL